MKNGDISDIKKLITVVTSVANQNRSMRSFTNNTFKDWTKTKIAKSSFTIDVTRFSVFHTEATVLISSQKKSFSLCCEAEHIKSLFHF